MPQVERRQSVYWDQTPKDIGEREPVAHAIATRRAASGPFLVKAIWTLE